MTRHPLLHALGLLILACSTPELPGDDCTVLEGREIEATFADVIDGALVSDGAGGTATNHWCANGRFSTRWENPRSSGSLEGRWWVENGERCVEVEGALPDDGRAGRCAPILRCGERLASLNAEGEVHGWHVVEPAPCPLD